MDLKNEADGNVKKKIGFGRVWLYSIRSLLFWIGMGMFLLATLISATVQEPSVPDEEVKLFRIFPVILIYAGILIANLGFIKSVIGKIEIKSPFNFLLNSGVCLGIGFFANSLFAEIFGYSLYPSEAPYCWLIIGAVGLIIGSLIMFFTTRKGDVVGK